MRHGRFGAVAALLAALIVGSVAAPARAQSSPAPLGSLLGGIGGAIGNVIGGLSGNSLTPTPGTESFSGFMAFQGVSRTWGGIRPAGAPAGGPMIILLHPRGTTPEQTANLTRIGRLAAAYGAWVYLPESVNAHWNDDPGANTAINDVGFLAALVNLAVGQNKVDGRRVYVFGYSNGGFMAQRFACERSALVAGLVTVASTLHDAQRRSCNFQRPMPVVMFAGTGDPIVPYRGLPTLAGAEDAMRFFAQQARCAVAPVASSSLPHPNSGPSVTLARYGNCAAGGLAHLYTINGGGHTWPGSQVMGLGTTTQDVDATIAAFQTVIGYALP